MSRHIYKYFKVCTTKTYAKYAWSAFKKTCQAFLLSFWVCCKKYPVNKSKSANTSDCLLNTSGLKYQYYYK